MGIYSGRRTWEIFRQLGECSGREIFGELRDGHEMRRPEHAENDPCDKLPGTVRGHDKIPGITLTGIPGIAGNFKLLILLIYHTYP